MTSIGFSNNGYYVWGASFNNGNVTQMVAHTGKLVNVFTNYGFNSPLLTADNNYVWIASTDNDSLTQLDPVTGAYRTSNNNRFFCK